jgi:hypothetical protein
MIVPLDYARWMPIKKRNASVVNNAQNDWEAIDAVYDISKVLVCGFLPYKNNLDDIIICIPEAFIDNDEMLESMQFDIHVLEKTGMEIKKKTSRIIYKNAIKSIKLSKVLGDIETIDTPESSLTSLIDTTISKNGNQYYIKIAFPKHSIVISHIFVKNEYALYIIGSIDFMTTINVHKSLRYHNTSYFPTNSASRTFISYLENMNGKIRCT